MLHKFGWSDNMKLKLIEILNRLANNKNCWRQKTFSGIFFLCCAFVPGWLSLAGEVYQLLNFQSALFLIIHRSRTDCCVCTHVDGGMSWRIDVMQALIKLATTVMEFKQDTSLRALLLYALILPIKKLYILHFCKYNIYTL